jgi:hypothetical protein
MEIRLRAVFTLEVISSWADQPRTSCIPQRHPNVWQLFGFAATPDLHALIYHDGKQLPVRTPSASDDVSTELIPLKIYRQLNRPTSDLVWVCVEGMLVRPLFVSAW